MVGGYRRPAKAQVRGIRDRYGVGYATGLRIPSGYVRDQHNAWPSPIGWETRHTWGWHSTADYEGEDVAGDERPDPQQPGG